MIEAATAGCAIILPSDGVVAKEFKAGAANEIVADRMRCPPTA